MAYVTAKPPSMLGHSDIRREFRNLLDSIHACDERNGTHTPSSTWLLITATARRLGVTPAELVNEGDD